MSLTIGTGGGPVAEAAEIHVGTGASAPAAVLEGWVGVGGGAMQRFYLRAPALAASASPDQIYWQTVVPASFYASASDATVTVFGGTAPYNYAWQTDNGAATINDATAQTTGFQSSDGYPAQAWCVVTDDDGTSVETNRVSLV